MKSFTEGLLLISAKNDMIADAKQGRYELAVEITQFCPIKKGEKHTIVKGESRHESHVGKTFIVDAIRFHDGWPGDGFIISGFILRADGSVGRVRGEQHINMKPKK